MQLTPKQLEVMAANGHLLVTGGPGSGKTTVSILKAAQIARYQLRPGQRILFLSFARATVSRVLEAIRNERQVSSEQKRLVDVETYHSFFWRILKAHGYLIGLPRNPKVLTPSNVAIALSALRIRLADRVDPQSGAQGDVEHSELRRLAKQEGQVCFDLFAQYAGDLVHGSERIRRLITVMYPTVILDEFQDTNAEQWRVVRALGKESQLIALADPEQRIYEWIGADPERLLHFVHEFNPGQVDLSTDNHRSANTEIPLFGNDLLSGAFRQKSYKGVVLETFDPYHAPAMTKLVTTTYEARKRLIALGRADWSLAILVPTKRMTRQVSDAFRSPPAGLSEIAHSAVIEMDAAILAAEVIAFLLQPVSDDHIECLVELVRNYFQGKGGNEPTKAALKEAESLQKAYDDWVVRKAAGKSIRSKSVLVNLLEVYGRTLTLPLTGDPDQDWRAVRQTLETGPCTRLQEIAEDARNLRILNRGSHLRQALALNWRENGAYQSALSITRGAFIREHFSTNVRPEAGVIVMNMHKAKGKQFDEVIIFEGWPVKSKGRIVHNPDRIVRLNARNEIRIDTRYNLRVSVTRSRRRTTILTPKGDPCVLLVANKGV